MLWDRLSGYMVLLCLILIACLGHTTALSGQTKYVSPLKRENPESLRVEYRQHGECPFKPGSIDTMIDGVLTRSRIKRIKTIGLTGWLRSDSRFRLAVNTFCSDTGSFTIDVGFAEYATIKRSGGLRQLLMYHDPYRKGTWGTFNPATETNDMFLRNAIKVAVEDAITDYLKANFDL